MNIINESWVINISEEGDYKKGFVSCYIQCKVVSIQIVVYNKYMTLNEMINCY